MKQLPLGVRPCAHAVFASFAAGPNTELVAALEGRAAIRSGCGATAAPARRTAAGRLCPRRRGTRVFPLRPVGETPAGSARRRRALPGAVHRRCARRGGDLDWNGRCSVCSTRRPNRHCRLIFAAAAAPAADRLAARGLQLPRRRLRRVPGARSGRLASPPPPLLPAPPLPPVPATTFPLPVVFALPPAPPSPPLVPLAPAPPAPPVAIAAEDVF